MTDNRELYYAHMEAYRHEAEAAYFKARPLRDDDLGVNRIMFRAGFERAYDRITVTTRLTMHIWIQCTNCGFKQHGETREVGNQCPNCTGGGGIRLQTGDTQPEWWDEQIPTKNAPLIYIE